MTTIQFHIDSSDLAISATALRTLLASTCASIDRDSEKEGRNLQKTIVMDGSFWRCK
jgi:hypothetical protein